MIPPIDNITPQDQYMMQLEDLVHQCGTVLKDMMDIRYMGCPFREHRDSMPCGECEACKFTTEISCRNVELCNRIKAMLAQRETDDNSD